MMDQTRLIEELTRLIQAWDRLMQVPGARPAYDVLAFLFGVSGAFWFLSRLMSYAALKIHDNLDHSLAVLFAVAYNAVLALLFASVMFYAILAEKGGSPSYLLYQFSGFVFLYVILGAAYADKDTGRVNEYGILGYAAGLIGYLILAVRREWASHPLVQTAHGVISWMLQGWTSRLMVAYALYEIGRRAWHAARESLARNQGRLHRLRRRFFFEDGLRLCKGES